MISAIEAGNDSSQARMKLHIFAFAILSPRNAVFLFSRLNIDEDQLNELEKDVRTFSSAVLYFLKSTQQCGQ